MASDSIDIVELLRHVRHDNVQRIIVSSLRIIVGVTSLELQ